MRLINHLKVLCERIREYIRFVKPRLPSNSYDVEIRNTKRGYSGCFTPSIKELAGKEIRSPATTIIARKRPLVSARIQQDGKGFPIFDERKSKVRTTRIVKLYYEEYDEKNEEYRKWYAWHRIPITKAYVERKNSQLRDKGKSYSYSLQTGAGGYVSCLILSREEALVHVLAHEFIHYWQYHHPGKRGKVWGARGLTSERDADAYAIRKTREWRRSRALTSIPNIQTGLSRNEMEMSDYYKRDFLLEDDSKEFGLTFDEYQILLEDIQLAIDEGNKKYGYGNAGYLAEDGDYYLLNQDNTPKYVDHIAKRHRKNKSRRPSVEEVAIARGIIKVRPVGPTLTAHNRKEAGH